MIDRSAATERCALTDDRVLWPLDDVQGAATTEVEYGHPWVVDRRGHLEGDRRVEDLTVEPTIRSRSAVTVAT